MLVFIPFFPVMLLFTASGGLFFFVIACIKFISRIVFSLHNQNHPYTNEDWLHHGKDHPNPNPEKRPGALSFAVAKKCQKRRCPLFSILRFSDIFYTSKDE